MRTSVVVEVERTSVVVEIEHDLRDDDAGVEEHQNAEDDLHGVRL